MKRIVFLFAIAAFALSPIGDSFAQTRTAKDSRKGLDPKFQGTGGTEFDVVAATSSGSGVLIDWQMKAEKGNMGFRIFRIAKGSRVQANAELIFGSAAKAGTFPLYGEQYSFLDRDGKLGSVYEIEAKELDGNTIISSSVSTSFSKEGKKTKRGDGDVPLKSGIGMLRSEELILPPDVISAIGPQSIETDPDVHRWVVSHVGVRIGVKKEGIYQVPNTQLQAAGFDTGSDSTFWQLYLNGVQQAMTVGPGYIEFYGNGIDTIESDIQGYFLIVGDTPGKRIRSVTARPSSGTVLLPGYDQTFTLKERINYLNSIFNGPDENYFGALITNSVASRNITLNGIDFSDTASTIELKIQGFSNTFHNVQLTLNGQALTSMNGLAQLPFVSTQTIPTSLLRDASLGQGNNVLTLKTNDPNDFNLFDTVKIQFNRKHTAAQNTSLRAYTVNSKVTKLTGFASANTRIFDVSKPEDPKLMTNVPFQQQGATYGATIPAGRAMSFYAVENSGILEPFSVTPNDGELLGVNTQGADLIIIAYKDFMAQAQVWANYRTAQGFSVKVVNVDEVFNEFNFGVLSSDSIETFLDYAYDNWRTAANAPPRYVLLIGDASYDSRNYSGTGFFNFVPTRIVTTIFTETGSDESLADFNNDGLAEMAVGRIPARTGSEVTAALSKVTNWEANLNDPLSRGALFAYDVPDGYGFQQLSEGLRDLLPPSVSSTMVARGKLPPFLPGENEFTLDPSAQANLLNGINTGKYIVNYSGHGASGTWAATTFFFNNNVASLTNHNNESLFTMLTCLNGYFLHQSNISLAETLLAANNGGAVAAWSSTGLTTPDVQEIMARRFFEKIGQGTIPRLGDVITDAKSTVVGGTDVRLSWALLGDPMLKVR